MAIAADTIGLLITIFLRPVGSKVRPHAVQFLSLRAVIASIPTSNCAVSHRGHLSVVKRSATPGIAICAIKIRICSGSNLTPSISTSSYVSSTFGISFPALNP